MKYLLYIVGSAQIIGGLAFAAEAQSAIHQILAAITFGFGAICFGLGGVIDAIQHK